MEGNFIWAFTLTLIAGLSTGIGSCIAFFAKKTNTKFLSISLGFSAGVMIYVSMIEIFVKAKDALSVEFGSKTGYFYTMLAFFGGMLFVILIDKFIPDDKNLHEIQDTSSLHANGNVVRNPEDQVRLMRTGLFTALAVAIHNFPEGLATFVSAMYNPTAAIPIVVAIAIHNIPEGIAVSVPIYYATGNKKRAFIYSFLSGLTEPVGAIIGYLILMPFMSETVNGIIFGAVAGIMVFISLDELLPSAREYGEHHLAIYGMVAGMAVMGLSLWLFM